MPLTMPEKRLTNSSFSESDVEAAASSDGSDEKEAFLNGTTPSKDGVVDDNSSSKPPPSSAGGITATGLKVLILLAVQNCSKNLLLRYVMKEKPTFLTSAAVIGVEMTKLTLSTLYILLIDKRSLYSIYIFMREDYRNLLLLSVPAAAYNLQSSLEYVALANLDAAMFSVLVQTKLCMTAICAFIVMRKKLKRIQIMSLILLTVGVMLCNLTKATSSGSGTLDASTIKGICATLGIATSSGFASVYTEKVIKAQRNVNATRQNYSLAYMQVQLATASLIIMGMFAMVKDFDAIVQNGLWHNFTWKACVTVVNSAIGGLIVAAVLKFSDSVLKGYATACSVVMTGVLSMVLFGTQLNIIYFMGIINVVIAVLLYNGNKDALDQYVC